MSEISISDFLSYSLGIVVLFLGVFLNRKFGFLRKYNIPEAVSGGLVFSFGTLILFTVFGLEVSFGLETRDYLLVYFFTSIGLNAKISDLIKGGRSLFVLLLLTLAFIVVQDVVGVFGASVLGINTAIGVLIGSASLIGGHGTAIAWSPEVAALGVDNALEIGMASATLGLVIASLIGGPIAMYLINKYKLRSDKGDAESVVGISYDAVDSETVDHLNIMGAVLSIHISIVLGYVLNGFIAGAGLKLPLFVSCLLTAIVLSNLLPLVFPKVPMPAGSRALAIVSDYSLNLFLAMSLMGMQLWSIVGLAGPLFFILGLQTLVALVYIVFVLFRAMGSSYESAVLSAGFGGFALGATPIAIANMTAVTKAHGPSPRVFIILPLVAAFFVDITNAFVIQYFLAL